MRLALLKMEAGLPEPETGLSAARWRSYAAAPPPLPSPMSYDRSCPSCGGVRSVCEVIQVPSIKTHSNGEAVSGRPCGPEVLADAVNYADLQTYLNCQH